MSSVSKGKGYRAYAVQVSFSAAGANVVLTRENEVFPSPVWSRTGVGVYQLAWTPGAGPAALPQTTAQGQLPGSNYPATVRRLTTGEVFGMRLTAYNNGAGTVTVNIYDMATAALADPSAAAIYWIEMRVYP